jgi:hypothetical protein
VAEVMGNAHVGVEPAGRVDIPSAADLTTRRGVGLGRALRTGTDFALGVIPRGGVAGEDRIVLYSPALGMIEERTVPPASFHLSRCALHRRRLRRFRRRRDRRDRWPRRGPAFTAGINPGDRVTGVDIVKVTRAATPMPAVRRATGAPLALEIAAPAARAGP